VLSVARSPDGRYIASGSADRSIQIWNAETVVAVSKPLHVHMESPQSVAHAPNEQRALSISCENTIQLSDPFPHISIQHSSPDPLGAPFSAQPDPEGWVKDSEGGLLYWVPPDCRTGLHSPALLTIPPTSHVRPVSLKFDEFAFGTSWTQIFQNPFP